MGKIRLALTWPVSMLYGLFLCCTQWLKDLVKILNWPENWCFYHSIMIQIDNLSFSIDDITGINWKLITILFHNYQLKGSFLNALCCLSFWDIGSRVLQVILYLCKQILLLSPYRYLSSFKTIATVLSLTTSYCSIW